MALIFRNCNPRSVLPDFRQALINVIPAQAGIYKRLIFLDSRLRVSDESGINQSFLRFLDLGQLFYR
jgi:hypothetical protein